MKKIVSGLVMLATAFNFSGCATIVDGRTQDVMIRSNPAGATVAIDEITMGTTPMVANLIRKKRHSIHLAKGGYQDVSQATTRGFNWWYLGNLIFGGIIGLIVDPCTGAMYKVEPGEINVSLPEGGIAVGTAPASASQPAQVSVSQSIPAIASGSSVVPGSPQPVSAVQPVQETPAAAGNASGLVFRQAYTASDNTGVKK